MTVTPVPKTATPWTPEQYWEFVSGYAGEFEANGMRDMLADRGLVIVSSAKLARAQSPVGWGDAVENFEAPGGTP